MATTQVLLPNTYIYVQNTDTGEVRTETGPKRVVLHGNEKFYGDKKSCVILLRDQYVPVNNPYDPNQDKIIKGERSILVGPCAYAPQYQEILVYPIQNALILSNNQAVRLIKSNGEVTQMSGPCRYIPDKYTSIVKVIDAIHISDNEGIYIIDTNTSKKKLILGPQVFFIKSK